MLQKLQLRPQKVCENEVFKSSHFAVSSSTRLSCRILWLVHQLIFADFLCLQLG